MLKLGMPPAVLRRTVNTFAPGPLIVRFLLINNSPLVSVIVPLMEKLIVSLAADSDIRCRSDSGPVSLRLFTVRVVAKSGAPLKTNAVATITRRRISIASGP
jgi:hypothetical protein